ncbi:MAG: O-antigen ligase family protein [Candidatus Omnitrophica bacterium]|nr:O-antigen ligase family protein [Candidatus Omnitrophota bacterium]
MFTLVKHVAFYGIYIATWVILLLSITGRVRYGLYFLIPLLPLQNIMMKLRYFPLGKDLNDILLIGMIIGWLMYSHSKGKPIAEKSLFNKLLFFYLIFTYFALWRGSSFLGLSAPVSVFDPRVQNWKNYIILPLLFILTLNNIKDKKEMKMLFVIMCLSMFLMNFYTIRQVGWLTAWWNRFKITGTFYWLGPNEIAAFYATYTFVLIGLLLLIKDKRWKIILGILIFQNIYCDLFLFSRGAYLATVVGLFLIGILRSRKLLPIVVVMLIFWNVLLPSDVIQRIEVSTEEKTGEMDGSASKRLEYWQESIEYFKSSPVVGIGFNTVGWLGSKRDTHNLYLRTLAEEGIIGLSFLLLIMGLAFKRSLLLFRKADDKFLKGLGLGFCACVAAVMVGNLFGDRWTYLPLGAYFWVFLGMVERGNLITSSENKAVVDVSNGVNDYKAKIDRIYGKKRRKH